MSRDLGNELPGALLSILDGHDLSTRLGKAILIATVDPHGWAHPALLSYGEVVAVDVRRMRLALYAASGTSANLRRSGRITLCLVEEGMAYYVKGQAVEQQSASLPLDLARFEATVERVLVDQARGDLEPSARITSGIEFDAGRSASEQLSAWGSVLGALRSSTC